MSRKRNLKYQFVHVCRSSFHENIDKHSLKKHSGSKEAMSHIFSYREYKNLLDTGILLSKYVKSNYPGTRYISEISPDMVQGFLENLSHTNSSYSLKVKVSILRKLQILINKTYHLNLNWKDTIYPPISKKSPHLIKLRDQQMTLSDFNKIIESSRNSRTQAIPAILLGYHYALRVSEACKLKKADVNYENMTLHIRQSKGGRSRLLQLKPESLYILTQLTKNKTEQELLISIKPCSINKFLNRKLKSLGLKYKYPYTSFHSIRKLASQMQYDCYRQSGLSKHDSLEKICVLLGHSLREDIQATSLCLPAA